MKVIVRSDAEAVVGLAARLIAERLQAGPGLVLGPATGRTMERPRARRPSILPRLQAAAPVRPREHRPGPHSPARGRPRCAGRPGTRDGCAPLRGGDGRVGWPSALDAREVLLLATGAHEAEIVARAVEEPIASMVMASALQLHPSCKVILDEPAAAALQGRGYDDFVLANEPGWAGHR